MEEWVDGFINLNMNGRILDLCKTYYDENIVMTSDGEDFANSREEAYAKQKPYVDSIGAFVITLLDKDIKGDKAEITFKYDITLQDGNNVVFTGKHVQQWKDGKITREDYVKIA